MEWFAVTTVWTDAFLFIWFWCRDHGLSCGFFNCCSIFLTISVNIFVGFMVVPLSPCMTIMGSRGIAPRNGMLKSLAAFSPPPFLKRSILLPQCGQVNPLMFSMIPSMGRFIFLTKFIDFRTLTRAISCGVVTMIAPVVLGMSCEMLSGSSPVPGGRSMMR